MQAVRSTQGTSTVTFDGTAAAPTSWSATSIVAPVPSGATTGNLLVTVSGVASNAQTFTVGTAGSNVYYYIEDMLGSSRTIVQDGARAPCYDADFYPFGGERVVANACPQNYKFEGKERDAETGNDDFGARYYSSRFGRWLSADWSAVPAPVPYANLTNPQTLNLYAMVSDNPETFADLDGHAGQGQASEGSNTNIGCNYTSNKCNDDTSNHNQNAAQTQQSSAAAPAIVGAASKTADVLSKLEGVGEFVEAVAQAGVVAVAVLVYTPAMAPASSDEAPKGVGPTSNAQSTKSAGTRSGDLPAKGKPNSSASKDRGNGKGQIRDYGRDGRAVRDFDFGHDHNNAGDPHVHDWDWSKTPPRQPARPLTPDD